jgi:hypothetical protein
MLSNVNLKPKSILSIDLNLPDFTEFLEKSNEDTINIKEKFNQIKEMSIMNDYWHERLYEENATILLSLGNVSQAVFNVQDKIEETYTNKYINAPALAKMLYYEHYEKLHQPFSILKNRCWRLFDELDKEYQRINNCNPSNWNDRLYSKKSKKNMLIYKTIANDIVNPDGYNENNYINEDLDEDNYPNDSITEDLVEDINKINIPIVVDSENSDIDMLINNNIMDKIINEIDFTDEEEDEPIDEI